MAGYSDCGAGTGAYPGGRFFHPVRIAAGYHSGCLCDTDFQAGAAERMAINNKKRKIMSHQGGWWLIEGSINKI